MTGKPALAAVAAVVVALAIAAVAAVSSTSSAAGGSSSEQVLRLVAKEVVSGYLDLGDPDFSIGDQIPFANDLYRDGSKVGEDGGWCVVTRITASGASSFKCVGSNSLPGGQLTVQGLVTYGPDEEVKADPYFFAITGGTGKYRGARGDVKIEEGDVESRLTFRVDEG